MKPEGSVACVFLGAGYFVGHFLLSPTTGLSLDLDGPVATCY